MLPHDREAEVKHVKGKEKGEQRGNLPRDPNLAEGERVQSPEEKEHNKRERERPREAPIIQKDVT